MRGGLVLRMTPMVDVVFLLLLFFLVGADWQQSEAYLPLKLLQISDQPGPTEPAELVPVYIETTGQGCQVRIGNGATVVVRPDHVEADLGQVRQVLKDALRQLAGTSPQRWAVEIFCGEQVQWQELARLYSVLTELGVEQITLGESQGQ